MRTLKFLDESAMRSRDSLQNGLAWKVRMSQNLEAPQNEQSAGNSYRWLSSPRWYLWEGGFLLMARADGVVPPHAHHAIQIVIAIDGTAAICGPDGHWREGRGLVVRPDAVHS